DSTDGFTAQIPSNFANLQLLPNNSVRAVGPVIYRLGSWFEQQYINIYPFQDKYSNLVAASKTTFESEINAMGFTKSMHSDSCILAYMIASQSGYTLIVSWGEGRGYVAVGQKTPDVL